MASDKYCLICYSKLYKHEDKYCTKCKKMVDSNNEALRKFKEAIGNG